MAYVYGAVDNATATHDGAASSSSAAAPAAPAPSGRRTVAALAALGLTGLAVSRSKSSPAQKVKRPRSIRFTSNIDWHHA